MKKVFYWIGLFILGIIIPVADLYLMIMTCGFMIRTCAPITELFFQTIAAPIVFTSYITDPKNYARGIDLEDLLLSAVIYTLILHVTIKLAQYLLSKKQINDDIQPPPLLK